MRSPSPTSGRTEWCYGQILTIEGYDPSASDRWLAGAVLRVWTDTTREQGGSVKPGRLLRWPFASSRPRKGHPVTYQCKPGVTWSGCVEKVEGDICHVKYPDLPGSCFIWRFKDGLNTLHDWPTKAGAQPEVAIAGEVEVGCEET